VPQKKKREAEENPLIGYPSAFLFAFREWDMHELHYFHFSCYHPPGFP